MRELTSLTGFARRILHPTAWLRQTGTASYDRVPSGDAFYGDALPRGFRHFAYGFARRILHPTARLRQKGFRHFAYGFARRILHPTARLRREGSGISLTGFARRILHPTAWLRQTGTTSYDRAPSGYAFYGEASPDGNCILRPGSVGICILRRGFARWELHPTTGPRRELYFTVRLRQTGTVSYDRTPPGTASYGVASPGGFRHFAYGFARRITASNGKASPGGKRHNADRPRRRLHHALG